jgi:hypothetical protein
MASSIYTNDFAEVFTKLLNKNSLSCYQISQYTSLDQAYLSRLKHGEKKNPSSSVLIRLSLALARLGNKVTIYDIEELWNAVGRTILIPS